MQLLTLSEHRIESNSISSPFKTSRAIHSRRFCFWLKWKLFTIEENVLPHEDVMHPDVLTHGDVLHLTYFAISYFTGGKEGSHAPP